MNIIKKCAVVIALSFITVPSLFAVVEMRGSLYVAPFNCVKIEDAESFYAVVPVGTECAATFYFGKIRLFNFGLNIGLGGDIFQWTYSDSKTHEADGSFNTHFVIGPALRFGIPSTRSSFYVSPGFIFNFMRISNVRDDDAQTNDFMFLLGYGFHIDAGYNCWIIRGERFGVGLNFGADYAFDCGRAAFQAKVHKDKIEGDDFSIEWSDMKYAHHLKIYAGVTFRFGR